MEGGRGGEREGRERVGVTILTCLFHAVVSVSSKKCGGHAGGGGGGGIECSASKYMHCHI